MFRLLRRLVVTAAALVVLVVFLSVGAASWVVDRSASGRIIDQAAALPRREVALVLGTSENEQDGQPNLHFRNRIAAAAELFRTGRVRRLLLSGNGARGDDEPSRMRRALLALGVPDSAMTLDNAGFRTLDSMVRARRIYGVKDLVVVSDRFHVARALFLARRFGLDAVASPSRDVAWRDSARVNVREWFARVKACLDVYVLKTLPEFLDPKEPGDGSPAGADE